MTRSLSGTAIARMPPPSFSATRSRGRGGLIRALRRAPRLLFIPAACSVPLATVLADRTWDRGAGTNFWTDAANWNPDGVPTAADVAIFTDAGAGTVNLNGTSQPASGSLVGLAFNNATTG